MATSGKRGRSPAPPPPEAAGDAAPTVPPLPRARRSERMQSMAERLQGSKGLLAGLIAQSRQLARLNRIFHAYLPPHLQPHARLVGVDPKQWTVQADGPAWATRLRYVLPSLRGQLAQQLGREVPPLKVRVVPPAEPPPPPRRQLTVSAAAAQVIEGAAQSIQDPALSAALARLARHARERRDG